MSNERDPITLPETHDGRPGSSPPKAPAAPFAQRETRYAERHLLGRGGMGEVHLQHDGWIGRDVAVKRLSVSRSSSLGARARFLREARVQGQLEHPGIVPVYDVGADANDGEYFTMKRVSGRTLAEVLSAGDAPRNRLLGLFRQVCLAVDYAHTRGVVHRDLKPSNVMTGDFGEVYVLDWGLARVNGLGSGIEERSRGLGETLAGQTLGTPGYMAPEQIDSAQGADDRADVYSLGVMLFEILAGSPLHTGRTPDALLLATKTATPVAPSERAPLADVPPELDALCLRATVMDPAARTLTAREMADAVERFLDGDRDLVARRERAAKHAMNASRAAEEALGGSPRAISSRATALREAGRALSLDPDNVPAAAALIQLIAHPPLELPGEVAAEIMRVDVLAMRLRNRKGLGMMAAFLAIVCTLPLCGFSDLRLLAAILVPLLLACALTVSVFVSQNLSIERFERRTDWFVGLSLLSVSAISLITTSAIVVPVLALVFAMGAAAAARPSRRLPYLTMGVLAFLVPSLLEIGHVTSLLPGLSLAQGVAAYPLAASAPHLLPLRLMVLTATCASIMTPLLTVFPVLDAAAKLRTQSLLQAWHLRNLAPSERRDPQDSA